VESLVLQNSFFIEILLSLFALTSVRLVAIGHHLGGIVGLGCQTCWISWWIYTSQLGFLLIDAGLLIIYIDYIRCYRDKKI